MTRYNIYAGLGGSFGGASYQFTGMYNSMDEAEDEAYNLACEVYESYSGYHGIMEYGEVMDEYCSENNIDENNLTDEDYKAIDETYQQEIEGWIDYKVVKTDEDDIDEEDLILDYVIEDDNSSEADSE